MHRTLITLFFCELEKLAHTTFPSTAIRLQRKIKLAHPCIALPSEIGFTFHGEGDLNCYQGIAFCRIV